MPVQPSRLSIYAVGVAGDVASDAVRQQLVDGVHLRWVFDKSLGFPQHGFHLFRRPSIEQGERRCLRPTIDGLATGPLGRSFYDIPEGRITSDAGLLMTGEFAWKWSRAVWEIGPVGFDLAGRGLLRLELLAALVGLTDGRAPLGVEVRIGLRPNLGVVGERIELWRRPAARGTNPLIEKGVAFGVRDMAGVLRDHIEIEVDDSDPPLSGLAGYATDGSPSLIEARLPMPARIVFLRVSGMEGSIEGFAADGHSVGSKSWSFQEGSILNPVTFMPLEPFVKVVMRGVGTLHTFTFETLGRTSAGIGVRVMQGDLEVGSTLVQGLERQVVRFRLVSNVPFDAVEIDGGPGVLLDLCLLAQGRRGLGQGWEKLDGFSYPLGLPITHPDYPATGGKPVDLNVARTVALDRIRYGPPDPWSAGFNDLHDQLIALVQGGSSPPMADRSSLVRGTHRSPQPGPEQEMFLRRYPLDAVLLASLHPPLAQMVGLYWVDRTARPMMTYDYLLVADWQSTPSPEFASRKPDAVLAKLKRDDGLHDIDAAIVLGCQLLPPDAPSTPTDARCFALPGGTIEARDGTLKRAENVTGLLWGLDRTPSGRLNLAAPILYHLWRADLGADPGTAVPAPDSYICLTLGHALIVARDVAGTVRENTAWPPFRLYALDSGLPDGWYSYQVSGLDLFGRHSARSVAAEWWQWAPVADPRPWYYQDPPADRRLHAFAIHQADRVAPPPPVAIEATALDPDDPLLLRDKTYKDWRDALVPAERGSVVGLRVRWEWPEALHNQAPDLREYRIYLQPGRLNAFAGRVGDVQPAEAPDSWAVIDPPAPGAEGLNLQVAGREYPVLGVDTGPPWRVRVRGTPAADSPCALVIPLGHPLYADYRYPQAWSERYYVADAEQLHTDGTGPDGRPTRRYEVLLPATGDMFRGGVGHVLAPSRADPVAYAGVGVSAVDDRAEVADDPRWSAGRWGGRSGNEGAVGVAPPIFRVLREPPPAPVTVPDAERVYATRADYASRSFYTFRWRAVPNLRAHVFRAMDESVYQADWAQRPRVALVPGDLRYFPQEAVEPRWNGAKRQQIANELNQLNAFPKTDEGKTQALAYYRGLSNDGLRVLAGLADVDAAFVQLTTQPLDPADLGNADHAGPDNPDTYVADPHLRAYVDTLDGRSTNRYFYRSAYVDGAHNRSALGLSGPPVWLPDVVPPTAPVLASVAGGDRSVLLLWTAVPGTTRYLVHRTDERDDTRDLRLMGDPVVELPAVAPVVTGGAVDLGSGTEGVTAEHVYRLADVSAADDPLTAAPGPDQLAAPTPITDGRVAGVGAPEGTPVVIIFTDRTGSVQRTVIPGRPLRWIEGDRQGGVTGWYVVVAARDTQIGGSATRLLSAPSAPAAGRAYDLSEPAMPHWQRLEWVKVDADGVEYPYANPVAAATAAIRLQWTGVEVGDAILVERIARGQLVWAPVTAWQVDALTSRDEDVDATSSYRYRLRVRRANGNGTLGPVAEVVGN